jgi:hypothetical protein
MEKLTYVFFDGGVVSPEGVISYPLECRVFTANGTGKIVNH